MAKNSWFNSKKHGLLLKPDSWQGWGITIIYTASVLYVLGQALPISHTIQSFLFNTLPYIFVLTFVYTVIAKKTST